jgi:carboxymethylenebutenolidase
MVKEQTVDKQANVQATPNLAPAQEALQAIWEEHTWQEFGTRSTENVLATMVEDAYVNNIPVMIGGVGKAALGEYYSKYVISQIPPDFELVPISRTIGTDQLVDEVVAKFTHTIQMDWMLPGVAPTGKRVEVPVVAIIRFRDGKIARVHVYWDQASILIQIGLLDAEKLPIVGVDSARKLMDRNLPSNTLIDRASNSN